MPYRLKAALCFTVLILLCILGIESPALAQQEEEDDLLLFLPAILSGKTSKDNDLDGFSKRQGDCNDMNATIHPGAIEICDDGIDQDCNGSDLPCPPPCTNIAGYWNDTDSVTITCCLDGECETGTFGGTDSIVIQQNWCSISYDLYLSGYGTFTRTGTVDGNNVHISGIFAVLQPGCTANQNRIDMNGTIVGDQINLQGSGIITGTCDGSPFQCTGTSTSTLSR